MIRVFFFEILFWGLTTVFLGFCLVVYSLCDVPGRSRGPYLGTTLFCSVVSVSYVAVKACVTFDGSMRWRQSPEGSIWQAVIMSSMLLAIAHVVVAYKTNCRERRKLVVFQIDLEAVSIILITLYFSSGFNYIMSKK